MSCDRNVCTMNEYNGVECEDCIHNSKQWDEEPCESCCGANSGYEFNFLESKSETHFEK